MPSDLRSELPDLPAVLDRTADELHTQNEMLEQLLERIYAQFELERPKPSLEVVKGGRDA